jgi:hypothetical protein
MRRRGCSSPEQFRDRIARDIDSTTQLVKSQGLQFVTRAKVLLRRALAPTLASS